MHYRLRVLSLAFLAFTAASVCRATFDCGGYWYNHPVVTSGCVVIGWKITGSHSPTTYQKGGAVPAANIDAIKHYGSDLYGANTFGGSFIVRGANGISVRGYINVKVVNGVATQVTFTNSALYRIFS